MKHVLVASNDHAACDMIRSCFPDCKVDAVSDRSSCFERSRRKPFEFIFIDLDFLLNKPVRNGHNDYRSALQSFWQTFPTAQIIVLSTQEMIREAVNAVKAGAGNYLTYPMNRDEIKYVVESISESIRMQSELDYLRGRYWQDDSVEVVRTNNPAMKKVFDKIRSVAPTRATVLLTGETGTGKGVIAKLIHRHSTRSDRQFIAVHCGAIPETLVESELFGHERGAFTGAVKRKLGKFEIAHGGTLFLDEIGTITASAQIKLLQVLQERAFQRIGGEAFIESDVRIIAASNVDSKKMSDDGVFRSDLYYRLNVFPIEIPALRERIEDIPILVETFIKRLNRLYPKEIRDVHPQVLEAFKRYPWPGNIRELENLIERAYILETSSLLRPESLPRDLLSTGSAGARIPLDLSLTLAEVRRRGIEDIERFYLKELLTLNSGRINATAGAAGISTRQLRKLLSKYGIHKEEYKHASAS
ncbi:MAG: sigma-54 dependent transcriptional regulator [Desulforhabdus sp.]|jgi:DNA-binding NtrC family response regulator|nr:sigma-54 dependent transcriptional regulator [Desulforhabdus sp.]